MPGQYMQIVSYLIAFLFFRDETYNDLLHRPMAQAVFQHLVKQKGMEAYFDRIEVGRSNGLKLYTQSNEQVLTILAVPLLLGVSHVVQVRIM